MIQYHQLKKRASVFQRLIGITISQFEDILHKVESVWVRKITAGYEKPGRTHKNSLADRLLMLLLYFRSHITYFFLGHLFSIDASNAHRNIQVLEPILAKITAIQKTKHLSAAEVQTLIIDATEQRIQRPKHNQKPYYSGKKKCHTVKTEIHVTTKGRIVNVSHTKPGSCHDFKLYKAGTPVHRDITLRADSGYQGLQDLHPKTIIPHKASRGHPLSDLQKQDNHVLASKRIPVEHVFAVLKRFRILSDRLRSRFRRYNLRFNILAGLSNFIRGFCFI